MKLFEEKLESKDIFNGHIFNVHLDKVKISDGSIRPREVVEHNGGVCVVPVDSEGSVYMVRQYRYAIGRSLLEIPAGKLEAGEETLSAAKRELSEETGCTANKWINLGVMYPTPGYCSEALHVYMATELMCGEAHLDDGEILAVEKRPIKQLIDMIMTGDICDGKTVFGIMKAYILLQQENCYRENMEGK